MTTRIYIATVMAGLVAACSMFTPTTQRSRPLVFQSLEEPVPAPAVQGFADVGGARLTYADSGGKGEPVVLLHPATGSIKSWSYQQPVLANAGYRVITYSRRGHAGSEMSAGAARESAAGDLKRLLDSLGVKRAHLVGVAAGGIYATEFALTCPDRVLSLSIAGSIVAIHEDAYMKRSNALRPKEFEAMPPEFRELGPQYRAENPAGVARWLHMERENAISPATAAQTRPVVATRITFQALSTLRVPVLLMTGDADLYTPPALLGSLAESIPGARVVVIEGSGHSPHWERPDAFNATLLRFLGDVR